jgi:hypothetical protein
MNQRETIGHGDETAVPVVSERFDDCFDFGVVTGGRWDGLQS